MAESAAVEDVAAMKALEEAAVKEVTERDDKITKVPHQGTIIILAAFNVFKLRVMFSKSLLRK